MLLSSDGEIFNLNKFGTLDYFRCNSITNNSVFNTTNVPTKLFTSVSDTTINYQLSQNFGVYSTSYIKDNKYYKNILNSRKNRWDCLWRYNFTGFCFTVLSVKYWQSMDLFR